MMKLKAALLILILTSSACSFSPHRRMDVCYSKVGVEGIWEVKETAPIMILQNMQTEEIKAFENDKTWQETECQ